MTHYLTLLEEHLGGDLNNFPALAILFVTSAERKTSINSAIAIAPLKIGAAPNLQYARGALIPAPEEPSEKALHLVEQANGMLDGGLHRCKEWTAVRDLYFHAGALFQSCNAHLEAGNAFSHSAAISRVFGSDLELASAASYAVDSFMLVDPPECRPLLFELVDIYRRHDRMGLVAKYEVEIAKVAEILGMNEEALQHYILAAEAYGVGRSPTAYIPEKRQCQGKAARLFGSLESYGEAAELFEKLAKDVLKRGTGPTQYYFSAMLCRLAASSGERFASGLAKAKKFFEQYQDDDINFQKGVEYQCIREIFESFDKPSLAKLDDAFEKYRMYRPKEDEWVALQMKRIRENLFQYLLPFM